MTHTGRVFGLRVVYDADLGLALEPDGPGATDLEVRLGEPAPDGPERGWQWAPSLARCREPGVVAVEIRDGDRITVSPEGDYPDWIREFLLGPGMAVALHQRGFLVLHGAAVRIGDGAMLILGDSGWGKSTLAAALDQAGAPLVADDLLPIRGALLTPGLARAKLLPDSVSSLDIDPTALASIGEKQGWSRPGAAEPLPIRRIVVLDPEDTGEVRLEPLRGPAAILELVRHTFLVRRISDQERPANLAQCASLASVPIGVLRGPRRLDTLPARVAAVR